MEITYFQKNLDKKEETFFREYLDQKIDSISSLLTKFADDAVLLKTTIEKFEKHSAFEVELVLKLPSKTLVAKEASHNITKAVDLSRDRLLAQIKKHLDQLRGGRSHGTIRKAKMSEIAKQKGLVDNF